MRRAAALGLAAALLAEGVAAKPGTPGPHYFAGIYERVGRGGGAKRLPIDDRVVVVPVGQSVAIRGCGGPETLMGFGPAFELENLMTGSVAGIGVECLFFNNGYSRPILTCRAADGAAWTLWPVAGLAQDAALVCGG